MLSHTGLACIHLRLSTDEVAALVEVWDENFGLAEPTKPDLDDERGAARISHDATGPKWPWCAES